mgnify:CR=1 FL=1
MGSLRRQRISDDEIVKRYQAGEARDVLKFRAKVPDARIIEILHENGVTLRTRSQVTVLIEKGRGAHYSRKINRALAANRR